MNPSNRTTDNSPDNEEVSKRVSALQIKNIDGKVVKSKNQSIQGEKGSDDDEDDNLDVNFGVIEDIETLGKK